MRLHNVNITDFVLTGLEYVRRRIGLISTLDEFMELEHRPYSRSDDKESLETGDVLMWRITPYSVSCYTRLINNFPISGPIEFEYSYGVYESEGIVSSVASAMYSGSIHPAIHIALLSDLEVPDEIIKISDLLKAGLVRSRSDCL